MATITLSSKGQVTIPVEIVRASGLKAGDKLDIELIDDRIVIWPKPASYADYFTGSMKGFWGSTEEIDQYIEELRASPEREAWYREFDDLLAVNKDARSIVDALLSCPGHKAIPSELHRRYGGREWWSQDEAKRAFPDYFLLLTRIPNFSDIRFQEALEKLKDLGAVREKRLEPAPVLGDQVVWYLVPPLVRYLKQTGRGNTLD